MRRTSASPPSSPRSSRRPTDYSQLVNVYKAVGGGWVNEADRLAPQPQGMAAREPREPAGN